MTQPLRSRRPARAVARFNRLVLLSGVGVLGLVAGSVILLPKLWSSTTSAVTKEQPHEQLQKLPEVITRELLWRQISAPAMIVQDMTPSTVVRTEPPKPEEKRQGLLDAINPLSPSELKGPEPEKKPSAGTVATVAPAPIAPKEPPPKKKPWALLAVPAEGQTRTPAQATLTPDGPTQGTHGEGTTEGKLIHPARWEIPANPLKTIYRSQTLTGRLLQAVHSDIPGQVKIQLTTPVLDKFGYDTTILPKDTLIIAGQQGRPQYGNSRLALNLEQLELPSGEIIELRATIGDDAGSNGVKGKTNNHVGKVILATGLSALLNIGVRTAVGTPSAGQFFQNPVQEAAQGIGQAVQRDATSIIDRELRIPPTITIKAGTFCTISLQENMTFNRPPVVVR